ncbi:MAG: hypothetical protein LLG45_08370 [Actinomycetia bacterium]|nr:hypothetical protein [Actinomycetes bacterium]
MNTVEIAEVMAQLVAGTNSGASEYLGFGEWRVYCAYRHLGCSAGYSATDHILGRDVAMTHDPCCPIYKAEQFCRENGIEVPKPGPSEPCGHSHSVGFHYHDARVGDGVVRG